MTVHSSDKVRVIECEDGVVWRVQLNAPKANVLDAEMTTALTRVLMRAGEDQDLKAVVLEGSGPHFSFGASVPEHLPDRVSGMLRTFHDLFRVMVASAVPYLAAVRGQCLGGGLELAAFCQRVFAAPDARLGQPEIKLGVFAPIGSLVLPWRVGQAATDDLCLSGRSVTAEEALGIGLVDAVAEDPGAAALEYAQQHLQPCSASSLRHAVAAARHGMHRAVLEQIEAMEARYLQGLMSTADAEEGIRAWLEKREPQWRNA